jgi:hypothetical protein
LPHARSASSLPTNTSSPVQQSWTCRFASASRRSSSSHQFRHSAPDIRGSAQPATLAAGRPRRRCGTRPGRDNDSLGELLLADIRRVFEDALPETELPTAKIVELLVAMQDRPWPEIGQGGKSLTAARFTRMVGKFGVLRRRLVVAGKAGPWGYRLIDFGDAFTRYLTP